jgi:hypothetical protein
MTEQQFKDHYVCTFLATYAATHYDDACAMGQHDRLEKHLAFEDAQFLADKAWEKVKPNDAHLARQSPECACSEIGVDFGIEGAETTCKMLFRPDGTIEAIETKPTNKEIKTKMPNPTQGATHAPPR